MSSFYDVYKLACLGYNVYQVYYYSALTYHIVSFSYTTISGVISSSKYYLSKKNPEPELDEWVLLEFVKDKKDKKDKKDNNV